MLGDFSVFKAPGYGYNYRRQIQLMVDYGRDIRDSLLWQYPVLPGAVMTYMQLASTREVKISASTARSASRAVEYLNASVSYNYDGSIEYGYPSILKRRVLDYLCIGRTMYNIGNGELEYLDPVRMRFVFNSGTPYWILNGTNKRYEVSDLIINHPYPIGGTGYFISPLAPIVPTAMLAWLIREHDKAAADGRKLRDIIIAGSETLAKTIKEAVERSIALWAGADPTSNGVAMAYLESLPNGVSVQDMIGRLSLANIPENFNRADFIFEYVNEIAAVLGIALRHFWNAEKATNRALEEIQDARQLQKGPSEFVRNEQRLINNSGALKQFGGKTRMGFIEETDSQTQETRAKVLKAYSESLLSFVQVFNAQVNGDAFLAWLQSEDILPADLKLISEVGTLKISDRLPVNEDPNNPQQTTEPDTSALTSASKAKSIDEAILDYGEVSMNLDGNIIERRVKPFPVAKLIELELIADEEFKKTVELKAKPTDFYSMLEEAHKDNYDALLKADIKEEDPMLSIACKAYDALTDDDHLKIDDYLHANIGVM